MVVESDFSLVGLLSVLVAVCAVAAAYHRWFRTKHVYVPRVYLISQRSHRRVVDGSNEAVDQALSDFESEEGGLHNLDAVIRCDLLDESPSDLITKTSHSRLVSHLEKQTLKSEQRFASLWWLICRGHLSLMSDELLDELTEGCDKMDVVGVDLHILGMIVYMMRYKISFYNGPKPEVYLKAFCKRKLYHTYIGGAGWEFYSSLAYRFVVDQGF